MQEQIRQLIQKALESLGYSGGDFVVEHPLDVSFGDYSTNVALVYAKQVGMSPRPLAEKIQTEIAKKLPREIAKTEIAGPGFINFYLSQEFFIETTQQIVSSGDAWGRNELFQGKTVMVEYTQPNPFKPFHIGHLMSNTIGESIARLVAFSGAHVIRANYQGDVGPHVAKALWGLMQNPLPDGLTSVGEQAQYIGVCYTKGSDAYDTDENVKKEINSINKKVYDKSDEEINKLYAWGRQVTLDAFEEIYHMLGTTFDRYYFESDMAPVGEKIVREHVGDVFTESDGAIVFEAEKHDPKLHTRVFINSQGLPTYETKEIGLSVTKFTEYPLDLSIVDTAIEQGEYMKVVQQAIALMYPEHAKKMKHITHGMMRFASGKMSSRKGNVVTGESLLADAYEVVLEKMKDRDFGDDVKKKVATSVSVAALKYSILRGAIGSDIVYDFEKSISFEGDSGPYLQYTAVRAQSVLNKSTKESPVDISSGWKTTHLERLLYRFPEVIKRAVVYYEPHHLTTYMTELASAFNTFYAEHQITDATDPTMGYKVLLTKSFYQTMEQGLGMLGVTIPEKM